MRRVPGRGLGLQFLLSQQVRYERRELHPLDREGATLDSDLKLDTRRDASNLVELAGEGEIVIPTEPAERLAPVRVMGQPRMIVNRIAEPLEFPVNALLAQRRLVAVWIDEEVEVFGEPL